MRLSDAIRKGCGMYPVQAFGTYQDGNAACALGAAGSGISFSNKFEYAITLGRMFPILERVTVCPVGCELDLVSVGIVITHLNDFHHWTREAIADWVESIEMGEAQPVVDETPTLAQVLA